MEPKVDIWMPLSIGDYLADTSHLDTTEHGAYLLMLMHYWRKGPLPNDPTQLANIAKLPKDAWSIHEAVLMQFFTLSQDGMLHQKRSDQEKEKWMKTRATAQLKAAKAARSRWNGASSIAQAKPMQCPLPSPSPLPSPTPKPSLPEVAKNATSSSNDEAQVRSTSATRSDGAPSDTSGIVQTVDSGTSANGPETPALLFDEAVTTRENSQNRAIREVFTYYLAIIGREPGTYTFSALRRKKGLARLQEALRMAHGNLAGAVEIMKAVIDEVSLSDWHMGRNEKTGGKSYCDWEHHLFRSTEQFETWVQRWREAAAKETKHA